MFAALTYLSRRSVLTVSATVGLAASFGQAFPQTGSRDSAAATPAVRSCQTVVSPAAAPPTEEPPAKIVVDPLKPELLTEGVAIFQFRTENVQIVPVFGPAAATVSPRLGHLHVTLDDAPWHWAHTSNDPVIVAPLPPGPHKILIELADADHQVLASESVKFDVPRR
jgi:Family of unknown function (DUF6130)